MPRPFLKAIGFLCLAALLVVGYLFLLSVFRGQLGLFSGVPAAIFIALGGLLLNYFFFRRDGDSLASIGLDRPRLRARQAAIGFAAGAVLVVGWALLLTVLGQVSWQRTPQVDPLAATAAISFAVFNNAGEELLYRGYLFLLIWRCWGATAAVAITCTLFTLMHIQAGVPWPNAVAGVLTSALVFAAVFMRWRSLPLVLALHVATNVMQELLGLRRSGLTLIAPVGAEGMSVIQGNSVLLGVALLNIFVAAAVLFPFRKIEHR